MNGAAVLSALVNSLWQSALLALVVAFVTQTRFGLSAARRHALWVVTLASCVMLPFADLAMPSHAIAVSLPIATSQSVAAIGTDAAPATLLARGATVVRVPASEGGRLVRDVRVSRLSLRPVSPAPRGFARSSWSWAAIAFTLWAFVAVAALVRLAVAFQRLRFAKRSIVVRDDLTRTASALAGPMRRVRAGISPSLPVPCALGFVHPAVSLPANVADTFDRADIDRVLRHECAHLARFDDVVKLCQEVATALFFFNPVVHIAARAMTIDREIACDDVAATLDRDRVAFARCLYEMARTSRGSALSPSLGFTGKPSQLGLRVERLLKGGAKASKRSSAVLTASACVVFVALAALGNIRLTNASPISRPALGSAPASHERPVAMVVTGDLGGPVSQAVSVPAVPNVPAVPSVPAVPNVPAVAPPARIPAVIHDPVHMQSVRAGLSRVALAAPAAPAAPAPVAPVAAVAPAAPAAPAAVAAPAAPAERAVPAIARVPGLGRLADVHVDIPDIQIPDIVIPGIKIQGVHITEFDVPNVHVRVLAHPALSIDVHPHVSVSVHSSVHPHPVMRVHPHVHVHVDVNVADANSPSDSQSASGRDGDSNSDDAPHDKGLLDALDAAGYHGLSPDDLDELADHGVGPSLLAALHDNGYGHFTTDELVAMADHGVSADLLGTVKCFGLHASADDLVAFADHDVSPKLIHATIDLAGHPVAAEDLVRVADAGASPNFVNGLAGLGYRNLTPDEVAGMADAGVSLSDVRKFIRSHSNGSDRPSPETMIQLKNAS